MINSASPNLFSCHLFKTDGLSRELEIVMNFSALPAMLVFHGIRHTIGVKFDDIAFTDKTETVGPYGQRALDSRAGPLLVAGLVNALVRRVPAHGMDVVLKLLLNVNERTLPRAITIVLQGRDHDRLIAFLCHLQPSQFAVHVAPMPNMLNDNAFGGRIDLVNDPIVADPKSMELFRSLQFEQFPGKRTLRQSVYCG